MWHRYACVRQADQSDCGAAALATITLHYRRPIALQRLRDLAGTDRVGTNLRGLLHAAEALGFSAKGVNGSYDALPQVPLPAIAHVKTAEGLGHFVVLYRIKKDAVLVADPARGIQRLSRSAFCQRWTGYLLLLVPEQHVSPSATGSAPISPWRRFLDLLSAHTSVLTEAHCCALLWICFSLVLSFLATMTAAEGQPVSITLIEAGARWKYLDNGSNQGTAWRGRTFNDSSWKAGPAPLGYGECGLPPLQTPVNDGPDTNRFITTCFRQAVEIAEPAVYTGFTLSMRRDDGAVVYVNGSEVWRTNMPSGTITSTTTATTTVGGADEARFYTAQLAPGVLVPGSNVVAVEVHQLSPTSSDLCFDLQLIGLPIPILVGAGDIAACNSTGDEATAALPLRFSPGTVATC